MRRCVIGSCVIEPCAIGSCLSTYLRSFAGLCLALMLQACGSSDPTAKLTTDDTDKSVLLIVSGGHFSCRPDGAGVRSPYGMDAYPAFATLKKKLEGDGKIVHFILTCHDNTETVFYIASDDKNHMYARSMKVFQEKVDRFRKAVKPDRTYMIGHSYGGWLAMKSTLAFQKKFGLKLDGLFTVDPISRVNCRFLTLGRRGCQEAPSDITVAEYQTIRASADLWLNFFQEVTALLHSSRISIADNNILVDATHMGMDSNAIVWANITSKVRGKNTKPEDIAADIQKGKELLKEKREESEKGVPEEYADGEIVVAQPIEGLAS